MVLFLRYRDSSLCDLVRPCLRRERFYRQRFQAHGLVVQPVAFTEIQRMLEPLVVIPFGEVITCMGAAAFCPGLRRHHGSHRNLDQVVEFQSFDPSRIEYTALVAELTVRLARSAMSLISATPFVSMSGKRNTPQWVCMVLRIALLTCATLSPSFWLSRRPASPAPCRQRPGANPYDADFF